jgi:hypothetical protein
MFHCHERRIPGCHRVADYDPRGYLPEHHAGDVVALADHLGLDRFGSGLPTTSSAKDFRSSSTQARAATRACGATPDTSTL